MKVSLNKQNHTNNILSRKKRRKLERKLIKAKKNAWHHRQQVLSIYSSFLLNKKKFSFRFQHQLIYLNKKIN